MNDNTLFAMFWALFAAVIISIVVATGHYHEVKVKAMADMVESGVSLMEAGCYMDDARGANPTCVLMAANK